MSAGKGEGISADKWRDINSSELRIWIRGEEKGRDQEGKIIGAGEVRTNLMEQYDTLINPTWTFLLKVFIHFPIC